MFEIKKYIFSPDSKVHQRFFWFICWYVFRWIGND